MDQFAETLRMLLDERGLSQAQIGRRLGLSPQAVSSWINGNTVPSHENVVRLEDALDVEPRGTLVRLAGYAAARRDDGHATPESLIRADPGLHVEDKRVLLRIIHLARDRYRADIIEADFDRSLRRRRGEDPPRAAGSG